MAAMFLFFAIVFIYGCKKTSVFDENGNVEPNTEFNTNLVKTWFYKVFQNSNDATTVKTTDEKYPVWKNGKYRKLKNFEVLEFPLVKRNTQIYISSDLGVADKKRVAAASLKRARFIKDATGKIKVIEVNYIPDLAYLQKNNYDISKVAFGYNNDDFTGQMIYKKWNGILIARYNVINGKIKSKISPKKSAVAAKNADASFTEVECGPGSIEYCVIERYCDEYTDGLITNCSDWEVVPNTCVCVGSVDGGDVVACEINPTPECECEQNGACDDDGGDDGEDEDEETPKQFNFKNTIVHVVNPNYEYWSLWDDYHVEGIKFSINSSSNYFTNIDYLGFNYFNSNYAMGGLYGYHIQHSYCTVAPGGTQSKEMLDNNKTIKVKGNTVIIYPNQSYRSDPHTNTTFKFAENAF